MPKTPPSPKQKTVFACFPQMAGDCGDVGGAGLALMLTIFSRFGKTALECRGCWGISADYPNLKGAHRSCIFQKSSKDREF